MSITEQQKKRRVRRKYKIRKRITGTNEIPRVSVYKSNKYFYVQVINDIKGETIVSVSNLKYDKKNNKLNKSTAEKVGEDLASKLKELKIEKIIFDRNGFLYTGRIKALADATRKAGIKF